MTDRAQLPLDERCSWTSLARHDDQVGTAPIAQRFFCVVQPGSWGRLALEMSGLDPAVGVAVARASVRTRTRPLLLRRPGRRSDPWRRRWFLATTTPGSAGVRSGVVGRDEELVDVVEAEAPGDVWSEPLLLVCTHGRHDTCCALRGRPVAAALAREHGDRVWECSHLGGDRFAANLLLLPQGLLYGTVDAASALAVVRAYEQGDVVPELLRGASPLAPAAQAAQAHARARTGELRIDALPVLSASRLRAEVWRVELGWRGGPLEVVVERRTSGPPQLLTCHSTVAVGPLTWALLALHGAG